MEKKSCGIPGVKTEKRIHRRDAKLVFTAFFESYFSLLKDMAPNYSKLSQAALLLHEQLLTATPARPLLAQKKGRLLAARYHTETTRTRSIS